jgi:hypothetical protein
MVWARMPAYITGTLDQELLLQNEGLAAENHMLKAQIKGRLLLSDGERATLAEIAGDDSGLVSQAGGKEVRWIQVSIVSRASPGGRRNRESDTTDGEGEPELGLPSYRGSVGEAGPPAVRPDRGQHSAAP